MQARERNDDNDDDTVADDECQRSHRVRHADDFQGHGIGKRRKAATRLPANLCVSYRYQDLEESLEVATKPEKSFGFVLATGLRRRRLSQYSRGGRLFLQSSNKKEPTISEGIVFVRSLCSPHFASKGNVPTSRSLNFHGLFEASFTRRLVLLFGR